MTGLLITVGVILVLSMQVVSHLLVVRTVRKTHGPSRVMFDSGFEMGRAQGWRDGRRAARPVVVPCRRAQ